MFTLSITQKNTKGFTLVETLVAVAILLLVVIGPLTSAQKGIQNAYYAKEQVTAVYLAQEAIEAVRALRDDEALSVYKNNSSNPVTGDWLTQGVSGCGSGCSDIRYDANNDTFSACSGSECLLKINNSGAYVHTGTSLDDSIFTRKISFDTSVAGAVLVTVDVSWNAKIFGSTKNLILQTWVYDHYQRFQ